MLFLASLIIIISTIYQLPHQDYYILFLFIFLPQVLTLFIKTNKRTTNDRLSSSDVGAPTVSIIISAKNEESVIAKTLVAVNNISYPSEKIEIFIVDNNSTDRTNEIATEYSKKDKRVNIYKSLNISGMKASGLNEVFPITSGEILFLLDADAIVDPNILNTNLAFFEDPQVGAVNAMLICRNQTTNTLTKLIHHEYSFDSGCLTGGATMIRRTAWLQAGGWNESVLTEDFYMTMSLVKNGWQIIFPRCSPVSIIAPEQILHFLKQRRRWAKGDLGCLFDHFSEVAKNLIFLRSKMPNLGFILSDLITSIGVFSLAIGYFAQKSSSSTLAASIILFMLSHAIRGHKSLVDLRGAGILFPFWFYFYSFHAVLFYLYAFFELAIFPKMQIKWHQFPHGSTSQQLDKQ